MTNKPSDKQNLTRVTGPNNRPFQFSFARITSTHSAAGGQDGGARPWARRRNRCADEARSPSRPSSPPLSETIPAPIPPTTPPRRSQTLSYPSPPPIPLSPWSIGSISHLRWLPPPPHLPSAYTETRRAGGSTGW